MNLTMHVVAVDGMPCVFVLNLSRTD